ncbi:MAG: hypothetical protein ACJ8G5_06105 [Burkholderiales bacterium]
MYYLCRLIAPRPTFATEMTAAEAKAMGEHVAYWTDLSVRDAAELHELQANDPAIKAQIGLRYEAFEMPRLVYASR